MLRRTDNARDTRGSSTRFAARDSTLTPGEEPSLAAHLITPRRFYTHHGIYVGNGRVIHYAGLARGLRRGPVEDVSLEGFARGRDIRVRPDTPRFDLREVVERARSRLGERQYRVLTNNCEHFCTWALCGEKRSAQVELIHSKPRSLWRALRAVLTHRYESMERDRSHGVIAETLSV